LSLLQVLGRDKVREGKEGTLKCLALSCLVVVVAAAVVCVVVVVMLLLRVAVVLLLLGCRCCCAALGSSWELLRRPSLHSAKTLCEHRQSVRIGAIIRVLRTIHSEISSVVSPVLG
jgi:hypothetical protein